MADTPMADTPHLDPAAGTFAAPFATPASTDDDDEWEYEYSATETETHLVTLDLSVPELVRRSDEGAVHMHNTRGSFRSWLTPMNLEGTGAPRAPGLAFPLRTPASGPANHGGSADETLQILDLHAGPIVGYCGMLFRGTWADTIGTEMLFAESVPPPHGHPKTKTKTDANATELVGAASARITCAPVELHDFGAAARAETMKRARKRLGFVIPMANGATAQRQKQGAFLESLMAVKHRRNEGDVVTVLAVEPKDADGAADEHGHDGVQAQSNDCQYNPDPMVTVHNRPLIREQQPAGPDDDDDVDMDDAQTGLARKRPRRTATADEMQE